MKIIHATGQMCNQFWIISNYLADSIEMNSKFAVWLPDFNLQQYEKLYNSTYVKFPLYPKAFVNFFGFIKYSKFINKLFNNQYLLYFLKFIINITPNMEFIVSDVTCKKSLYRRKHLNLILDIISPNQNFIDEVKKHFNLKKQNEIVIGIHIRHGDYVNFQNGKYFYSFEQYNQLMNKIVHCFSDKNVKFFIASNTKVDEKVFINHQVIKIKKSNSLSDLIGLSTCDYICGPPSTFSAWASLYKNIPLYFIEDINTEININSFIDIRTIWF